MGLAETFEKFRVGKVINPLRASFEVGAIHDSVEISYPTRLNAMALDPSLIVHSERHIYKAGEIVFSTDMAKRVAIQLIKGNDRVDVLGDDHASLVRHAVELVRQALGRRDSVSVCVEGKYQMRHVGLGSSSGTIAAVAAAMNELYGRPIPAANLLRYVAQNHGEPVQSDPDYLLPVQCLGGSAAAGLLSGGVQIIAGESSVIASQNLSSDLEIVIGIPRMTEDLDTAYVLGREVAAFDAFVATGREYGPLIAYRLIHEVLPALTRGDIGPLGDLIFDYRFKYGSIKNCSFVYPWLGALANKLAPLKHEPGVEVLSLSSVGPSFFVVTRSPEVCVQAFADAEMNIIKTRPHNAPYARVS